MKKNLFILFILSLGFQANVHAQLELDRKYSLESVGVLRSWDNVDGLFADYVSQAYEDYFEEKSRFQVKKLDKANELLETSKISYKDLIDDNRILKQVSRAYRVDTLLKTKIYKEGPQYRFVMDWLHPPKMDLIAQQSFVYTEPEKKLDQNYLKNEIKKALDEMVKKVPFHASVTGRDQEWVTVNIGKKDGLKAGDTLILGTLEEVRLHPLLHKIVEWKTAKTGTVVIDEVDDAISFCRVQKQEPGYDIGRYQKVLSIIPASEESQKPKVVNEMKNTEAAGERIREAPPRLGVIQGGPWVGLLSRAYSTGAGGKNGGGISFGAKVQGELWLTRNWFTEAKVGFGVLSYSQSDATTGTPTAAGTVSGSLFEWSGAFGFRYLLSSDVQGPQGYAKLGFQSKSFNLPASTAEETGSAGISSVFFGIGAGIPIRGPFGLQFSVDVGLLPFAGISGFTPSGNISGATDLHFYAGGYFQLQPKIWIGAGFDVISQNIGLEGGGSLYHSNISFLPTLLYYF